MSLIYGVIHKRGQMLDPQTLGFMEEGLTDYSPDRHLSYRSDSVHLGKMLRFNTPESFHSNQPCEQADREGVIAFDGRIDNRKALIADLGLVNNTSDRIPDEDLVLQAFHTWGEDCCSKILGDFAFVLVVNNTVFIARDHVGARPLFISENEHYLAFSSNKKALLALPWVDKRNNDQWLADLLCLVKVDKEATYYQSISSFLPAHYRRFTISSDEKDSCARYWALDINKDVLLRDDSEYLEAFSELLEKSVACRLRSAYPIASELSGGLDSTTVAGLANRLLNQSGAHPLIACSHVFSSGMRGKVFPYTDEKDLIDAFSKKHQLKILRSITAEGRGVVDNLERNVALHAGPSRSDLTVYSDELFENLKEQDSRVLLSGYGGDQIVSSFARGAYEELAASKKFMRLWNELSVEHGLAKGASRWLSWLLRVNFPFVEHALAFRNRKQQPLLFNWRALRQRLFVSAQFAEQYGYPQRHFDNLPWRVDGNVRERELYLFNRPSMLFRLEDSAIGAEYHGVEYRYPLLDKRLLEFCFALPTYQKYRDGVNRRMIRMSGKNLLPDSVWQRDIKTGTTIPNANYRRVRDKSALAASLRDMKTALGDVNCIDWNKLIAFANHLSPNVNRDQSEIPKAFDKSYQTLYALMNKV